MNTDKIYAEAIANEYAPKETSKVIALKKLDRKAKSKANIFAYTFGVIMALVLGTGMCLSINYPIYKKLLESGKKQCAFEIIQLAKEISEKAE